MVDQVFTTSVTVTFKLKGKWLQDKVTRWVEDMRHRARAKGKVLDVHLDEVVIKAEEG